MTKNETATWVRWSIGVLVTLVLALGGYALAQDRKVTTLEVQQKYTDQKVSDVLQRVEALLNKQEPVIEAMKRHIAIDERDWKASK